MEELDIPNNIIYQVIKNLINEEDDWWSKMSSAEQDAYIKKHPKSKKA